MGAVNRKWVDCRDNRAFIHLGMTKTGSSYIQQRIFSQVRNSNYYHDEIDDVTEAMTRGDHVVTFAKPVDPSKKSIFSHESLHGRPAAKAAPLLKRTFGEASILIVLREPAQWVESFYFQRIRNGETRDPSTWLKENKNNLSRQLNIDKLREEYSAVFGVDNFHILPYEMLSLDPTEFFRRLASISGLSFDPQKIDRSKINPSADPECMDAMRQANIALGPFIEDNDELKTLLKDFGRALVRHVTANKPAKDSIREQIMPLEELAPLYANLTCLSEYSWYPDYADYYTLGVGR